MATLVHLCWAYAVHLLIQLKFGLCRNKALDQQTELRLLSEGLPLQPASSFMLGVHSLQSHT